MQIPTAVRLLLAELELLSHGSTASWNSAGGHDADETVTAPFGESHPPHLELRAEYVRADTDAGRARVVARMHAVLREHRGVGVDRSRVVGEARQDETTRILREGEGFTPGEVALRFRCTPTRVRRVRLATGRDATLGRLVEDEPPIAPGDDTAAIEAAMRMKSRGMSVRLIGMELGRPKSTISDWLQRSAA